MVRVKSTDGAILREGVVTKKLVDVKTQFPIFLIQPSDSSFPYEIIQNLENIFKKIDPMQTLPKPVKRDDMTIKVPEQSNKLTEQSNKVTEQEQINNLRERISNLEFKNEKLARNLNNHYHELPTSGMRLYEEQHPFFKKS